ncbi:MAG: hypothetical protein AB7P02_13505 [Alphaproteobacteria bacterium]
MIRIALAFWLGLVSALGYGVFQVKYEVQEMESRLVHLNRAILDDQQAIHVLKAEWSFLNQPARLEQFARRHLDLAPIGAGQLGRIEDIPLRPEFAPPPASPPLARSPAPAPTRPMVGAAYTTQRPQR